MSAIKEVAVEIRQRDRHPGVIARAPASAADREFDAFARDRSPSLRRYAYLLTGNLSSADDLVQETLMRVYLAWDRIEDHGSADRYARTTMARQQISWWRKSRREVPVDLAADPRLALRVGADEPTSSVERDALWQLFAALTGNQRVAMVLRFYEDLDDGEIAEILGCSRTTVRTHISRGLARLRAAHGASVKGGRT